MTEAVLDIRKRGNSLGVRLPAAIARKAHLFVNQKVCILVKAGKVVITPTKDDSLSLEQRLAQFDPKRHGGEVMASETVGQENMIEMHFSKKERPTLFIRAIFAIANCFKNICYYL